MVIYIYIFKLFLDNFPSYRHPSASCSPLVQALELKPNYALAYILKGSLVLAEGDLVEAPKHFSQANNIRKDIYSYKGEGKMLIDTTAVAVV